LFNEWINELKIKEMYTVGVFYAWDWLALIVIAVAYFLCPKRFLEEKKEYIKFFLLFFSAYFFLFLIIRNLPLGGFNRNGIHWLFWIFLTPIMFVAHWLYPFRKTKRSKHLSFFLFFLAFFIVGIQVAAFVLHTLFGNNM
jgi:hypothetical protein